MMGASLTLSVEGASRENTAFVLFPWLPILRRPTIHASNIRAQLFKTNDVVS